MNKFQEKFNLKAIKRKQVIGAGIIAAGLIGLAILWILLDAEMKKDVPTFDLSKSNKKIEISKIAGGISAEEKWLQNAEGEIKSMSERLDKEESDKGTLNEKIQALEQIIEVYEKQRVEREEKGEEEGEEEGLKGELQKLKEDLEQMKNGIASALAGKAPEEHLVNRKTIKTIEINLDGNSSSTTVGPKYKLDYYLPAGSYAKAVLLSGIDASVGVNSSTDPRPVLLRVISRAKTAAAHEDMQKIDLIGCTVTGAASGDLSSERAFIRLVKMSCSREDGTAFESYVHGYISSQGKAGVRGEVISREGDFVTKSFLAGLISGIGGGVTQGLTPNPSVFNSNGQTPGFSDVLTQGVGKGAQNSANRLSEYLINRAEQYQPVISVQSGLEVEVVFNDGVYIDGRKNMPATQSQ